MSWTVEYNAEIGVVQCSYMGQVTADEFKEGTIKAIALAKDNNTKLFLIDDSKWQGGASVFGLFELPDLHEKHDADRVSRVALILPPPGTPEEKDAHFYETVCRNRGWNVTVFSEREEAIRWLTEKQSSNRPDAGDT